MEFPYQKDNKERIPLEHYMGLYEKLDPVACARRCGVPYDSEASCFTLKIMGREYRVAHPVFQTEPEASNPEKILLLRYLLEAEAAPASGKFITYREVPWGETYFRNFEGRCLKRLAFSFGGRLDDFRRGMERLGGKPVETGDAGYEFPFMEGLYMRFMVWAGDEEFPPSAQILFSDNFKLAFTAEDLAYVGDVSINYLKEAAQEG